MPNDKKQAEVKYPDHVVLSPIQQKRLAALVGVDEKEISGKHIAELKESLKWKVDPRIFLFEKICGKVVKKDPVTGEEYPVPFATVNVEDTDCRLLTYQPLGFPWSWHFPFFCHREIIGTTHTDACGNFCIWVPRFDIDWILRWRKHHICFPYLRPSVIDYLKAERPIKVGPFPGPDPGPLEKLLRISPSALDSVAGKQAGFLKNEISRMQNATVKLDEQSAENMLNKRIFDREMPPPLPQDFQKVLTGSDVVTSKKASAVDAVRSAIGEKLGLAHGAKELEGFSHTNFIGPFFRCIDYYTPEWQIILDVPDITFRVTQDTNGDGVEETIYSEGYFDVRWDSGPISNVTLYANSSARESHFCQVPPIPCGNVPALQYAGMMPLNHPGYFNSLTGYATRPNRPKISGIDTDPHAPADYPAQTPFCHHLLLSGCVAIQNAKYYRVKKSSTAAAGTGSAIAGLAWNNYFGALPIPIVADTDGWYPIDPLNPVTLTPVPRASLAFPNLVLDWPTPGDTTSFLQIELGNASKGHIADSAVVAITSDNTPPTINPTSLAWKYTTETDAFLRDLGDVCPMIKRGAVPRDIEVVFKAFVSDQHLRDAALWTAGCGSGSAFDAIFDLSNKPKHWHTLVTDNSVMLYQRYRLDAQTGKPGCYSFNCLANGRSMNPSGADGGNLLPTDWFYDPKVLQTYYAKSVAVVNEDLP